MLLRLIYEICLCCSYDSRTAFQITQSVTRYVSRRKMSLLYVMIVKWLRDRLAKIIDEHVLWPRVRRQKLEGRQRRDTSTKTTKISTLSAGYHLSSTDRKCYKHRIHRSQMCCRQTSMQCLLYSVSSGVLWCTCVIFAPQMHFLNDKGCPAKLKMYANCPCFVASLSAIVARFWHHKRW